MGKDEKLDVTNMTRRRFLITSVSMGAGLTLGVHLVGCGDKKEEPTHLAFSLVYNSQNFYTKATEIL